MNTTVNYQSPVTESLSLEVEGVICASGDGPIGLPIFPGDADPDNDVL